MVTITRTMVTQQTALRFDMDDEDLSRIKGMCWLCGFAPITEHNSRNCPTYPGEKVMNQLCRRCGCGAHPNQCLQDGSMGGRRPTGTGRTAATTAAGTGGVTTSGATSTSANEHRTHAGGGKKRLGRDQCGENWFLSPDVKDDKNESELELNELNHKKKQELN